MKKNRPLLSLVLLSVILSMFFVGTVAASEFQVIATRDPRTPPPTITAGGSGSIFGTGSGPDSFECPVGGVQGFGQVTPDAVWMAVCGQCLPTSTAFPTHDFIFPTRTPVIWVSGTPATPGPHLELTYTPELTNTPVSTSTPMVTGTPTQNLPYCDPMQATPTIIPSSTTIPPAWIKVDHTDPNVFYSGVWSNTVTNSNFYGGKFRYSNNTGSYFEYTFSGTGVRWHNVTSSAYGFADVYLDGVLYTTYDSYSSVDVHHNTALEITGLDNASHVLKVVVKGEKNPSSTDYYINADAFSYQQVYATPTPVVSNLIHLEGGTPSGFDGSYGKITFNGSTPSAGTSLVLKYGLTPIGTPIQITYRITVENSETGHCSNSASGTVKIGAISVGSIVGDVGCSSFASGEFYGYETVTVGGDTALNVSFSTPADWPHTGTLNMVVEIWASIECVTAPPTVSPTPMEGIDYCSSINNGTDGLSNQQISFWEPAGPPACMIIPSFSTHDLFNFEEMPTWLGIFLGGAIQVERIQEMIEGALFGWQIYTNAFTLCLQPYDFAPVPIFGTVLFVQTFVNVGLGMYIINVFTKR